MNQLGWLEGKNYTIEQRFGEGKGLDRLAEFAADLLRLNVDVILTSATSAALAAKKATREIPIVMASVGDPVGQGIVTSLARPEGNITGYQVLPGNLAGKGLKFSRRRHPKRLASAS